MKVNSNVQPVIFSGENGELLSMRRSNMGEPYRDGADFTMETEDEYFGAFLEVSELKRMRDFLNEYLLDK